MTSKGDVPEFVCERVCATDNLMKKLGSLAKGATGSSCTTVCGTSSEEACADACMKSICSGGLAIPAWNDACERKCTQECLKIANR